MNIPNVFAGDSFHIDANLENNRHFPKGSNWYAIPLNNLNLSNSSVVCPSNDCKTTVIDGLLTLDKNGSKMVVVSGDFRLVDNKTNGHFGPEKQNLIEKMDFSFVCGFSDIQEDTAKGTVKYICSPTSRHIGLDIVRSYNLTHYPYNFAATFELPSKHLVVNATEDHEPRLRIVHQTFIDKDGKIQAK